MMSSRFPFPADQTAVKPLRLRESNDPDWNRLKLTICELYQRNELKKVIQKMKEEYEFNAR